MRDLGNTVLVVEHDEDTIRKADYVLDLGPGAGKLGGYVVAEGTPQQIMDSPASLTGRYLSGATTVLHREQPRAVSPRDPNAKEPEKKFERVTLASLGRAVEKTGGWITVEGARSHNLREVTAHFPLNVMTVVTGVSGSGKSTLVNDILYRALARELYRSREVPGEHTKITGVPPD